MDVYITDQKVIAEALAQTVQATFNTKLSYFGNDKEVVLYIQPNYNIILNGTGRKLIKFYDGIEEIQITINNNSYKDIIKLKSLFNLENINVVNVCAANERGQLNFDMLCKCADYDASKASRIWLKSTIIDKNSLYEKEFNSKFMPKAQSLLAETIIDEYWRYRNKALFDIDTSIYSINMKEMFLLNMIYIKEKEIAEDTSYSDGYFRVETMLKDMNFKWHNKKKEDRISTLEEARMIIDTLKDKKALITKANVKLKQTEHPILYNTSDLYKDVQKAKITTIKELKDILNKLHNNGYITNPETESRHLPSSMLIASNNTELDQITSILSRLKDIPMYKPYVEYIKKVNEFITYTSRVVNDQYVDSSHAIIPTCNVPINHRLTPVEYSVYDIIVKRFLTMFMGSIEESETIIIGYVDANNYFKHEHTIVLRQGWTLLYDDTADMYKLMNIMEPHLDNAKFQVGEYIKIEKDELTINAGKPRGKSRYTVAALIDLMSNCGKIIKDDKKKAKLRHLSIGIPGERNIIISNLIDKKLVEVIDSKIHMTAEGNALIERAPQSLISLQMLEAFNVKIKAIQAGHEELYNVVRDHASYITKLMIDMDNKNNPYQIIDYSTIVKKRSCPYCEGKGKLKEMEGFIGCSNYPNCQLSIPKEKSQYNLTEKDMLQLIDNGVTEIITGFTFKNGKVKGGRARLKFNNKRKVEFDFDIKNI